MQVPPYINASVLLSEDEVDDIVQRHPSLVCRAKLMAHVAVTSAILRLRKGELDELDKLRRENQVLKSELTRLNGGGAKVGKASPPPPETLPWAVKRDGALRYYSSRQEARKAASLEGGTVVDCRNKDT